MNKKPKICMITDHCCVRVIKESLALIDKGYKVDLLSRRLPVEYAKFNNFSIFNLEMLPSIINNEKKDIDIFHCHSSPYNFIKVVIDSTQKPVIFDIHDLQSAVDADYNLPIEKELIERATKLVLPTEDYIDWIFQRYGIDVFDKSLVFHSYCVKSMMPEFEEPSIDGIVYQGGLARHRELQYISSSLPIYVYTSQNSFEEFLQYHEKQEFIFMGHLKYKDLLQEISKYRWGFIGTCVPNRNVDYSVPNKMFEYIAAGVPMLVLNSKRAGNFVEKYSMGFNLKYPDMRYPDIRKLNSEKYRKNTMKCRDEFWMEEHIKLLEDLYREVL